MEQTINTVQAFMKDVQRLVVLEIKNPKISTLSIEKIRKKRKRLEQIEEPFRTLAIRLLDEVLVFVRLFNTEGFRTADKYAREVVFSTMTSMFEVFEVKSYGI